jgi:hypothetical protein
LVPPEATTAVLYTLPSVAPGSEVVVIVNGLDVAPDTTRLMVAVAVFAVGVVESFTVTATEAVPVVVGVPLIAPVELLTARPLGNPVAE